MATTNTTTSTSSSGYSTDIQQVSIIFSTRIKSIAGAIPTTAFTVPVHLNRYGLSEIVNHLIAANNNTSNTDAAADTNPSNTTTIRAFDFIIQPVGVFLRTNLQRYLQRSNSSAEIGLILEIIDSSPEPTPNPTIPHPDWISSIYGRLPDYVLTGSYDGYIRLINTSNSSTNNGTNNINTAQPIVSDYNHKSACKTVRLLSTSPTQHYILSGGIDHSINVYSINSEFNRINRQSLNSTVHTDTVTSIDSLIGTNKFISASADQSLVLWDITANTAAANDSNNTIESSTKKSKKSKTTSNNTSNTTILTPQQHYINGHSQSITSVLFPHPTTIYSASLDSTIQQWDTESATIIHTLNGNKPITDLSYSSAGNYIATGHSDSIIRIWDIRLKSMDTTATVIKTQLKSHSNYISSISCNSQNSNELLSASYDNTIKYWDIRAKNIPLYTITDHTEKILSIDWNGNSNQRIVSGGADKQLRIHYLNRNNSSNNNNINQQQSMKD